MATLERRGESTMSFVTKIRLVIEPGWGTAGVGRFARLRRAIAVHLPYDPDGDGEGTWHRRLDFGTGRWQVTWTSPAIADLAGRCESEECLFGREWIPCKKRKGHSGIHRHDETWGWVEGDERA